MNIDKDTIFQLVIDDDPSWRETVLELWGCLNADDRRRIKVLASGRGTGGGGGDTGSGALRTVTADSDAEADDETILGSHATVPITVTLPAASANTEKKYRFKNVNDALMTIDADGGSIVTDDGYGTVVLNRNQVLEIQSDGTAWQAFIFP